MTGLGWMLLACAPAVTVTPESGPASGYYPVALSLDRAASEVSAVWVGGVPTYDLVVLDEQVLQVTVQGGPVSGPVEVTVETAEETLVVEGAFTYDDPVDPVFERFFAVGASLTMGVQGGVPTTHGALASPGAVLASLSGAYLPHPLLKPGLFPAIGPLDMGPPPGCEAPSVVDFVTNAALEVLSTLSDPETGEFGFQWGRLTPELMPRNLAVGDSDMADLLHGIPSEDFGQQFLAHLALDPYGAFGSAVVESQLEILEQGEPTLVICTDLYGNDVVGALLAGDDIDPERVTTLEEFGPDLVALLDRFEAMDAEVFLATLPRPSLLPVTRAKRAVMIEAGMAEEEVDGLIQEVEDRAEAMNAQLLEEASERPRIHVVDLASTVAEMEESGVDLGDEIIDFSRFGGLLSLDGVHFSDTGYALGAEQFVLSINQELGLDLPLPDLSLIHGSDRWRTEALVEGGLDVEACETL